MALVIRKEPMPRIFIEWDDDGDPVIYKSEAELEAAIAESGGGSITVCEYALMAEAHAYIERKLVVSVLANVADESL